MRKTIYLSVIIFAIFIFSGCSKKADEAKKNLEQPLEDVANYIPKEVDLNKKMQSDIQNATEKENERLQKTLNESGNNQ